ncbi:MAG: D-fructose-6-phosphate amidotransferase [Clostridia bacterium]|nr:D-fructose-6-phosphate amidotransferase [Clostridia bacterium]
MLIENIELTMSHVGLGTLNEYALLLLFGNAHSHHLTLNTGICPDEIKDNQGLTLYPAYFMTHLKVPKNLLLSTYKLWDNISVGVDVARFGETILESLYVLGKQGEIASDTARWDLEKYPSMRANSLIIVDVGETGGFARKVSIPKPECIAVLPKVSRAPEAIPRSKNIRSSGFGFEPGNLKTLDPIVYYVASDQDAAPGHAMVFAKFTRIMDWAEYIMLSQQLKPGFPSNVLQYLSVLERETFYYGNCFAGETLEVYIKGTIKECDPNYHGDSLQIISVAILSCQIEIYLQRNKTLLAIANAKKLLALPTSSQDFIPDIKRIINNLNKN